MTNDGWVKLSRGVLDNWTWDDRPFAFGQAWIDLILQANWKDTRRAYKGEIITQKRGEIITTKRALAERWGWSTKKVTRFLALLEADQMVSLKGNKKGTTITVEKYREYQDQGNTKETKKKQKGNTQETQRKHAGNTTEEKKEEKESIKKARKKETPPTAEEDERRLQIMRAKRDGLYHEGTRRKEKHE